MKRREFLTRSAALAALPLAGTNCAKSASTTARYETIDIEPVTYGAGQTEAGLTNLQLTAILPNGDGPFPIFVAFGGGGFEFLDWPHEGTYYRYLAERGVVVLHPWYRTAGTYINQPGPAPITPGDLECETLKRRAFRAAFTDQKKFLRWLLTPGNAFVDFCAGDTSRIFLGGWSAGGMSSIWNGNAFSRHVKGIVGFSCGFGMDNVAHVFNSTDDHTRDLREWLTEDDLGVWTPPCALFLTADDAIIGGHHNLALAAAGANVPGSWVFVKKHGDPRAFLHDGPQHFGDVRLGEETIPCLEAVRRFIDQNS